MDLLSWIKAKKAQQTADNVQNQLNQAVAAGDQLAETQQAGVGKDGTVYDTLNDRLNGEKGQTEASLATTNNRIDGIDSQLSDADKQSTTLLHGLSAITTDQATATAVRIFGRTLVNLLGKDGNCEDVSKWNNYLTTLSVDSTNYKYSSNSIKVTASSNQIGSMFQVFNAKANKHYIALADIKNNNAELGFTIGFNGIYSVTDINSTSWRPAYYKFTVSEDTSANFEIVIKADTAGQYGYIDGVRLYEIPQPIYDKIDVDPAYAGDALADKFPYVDSVQNVMNPYVKNSGKNLLPPFTSGKWTIESHTKVLGDYELELSATANYQASIVTIPVLNGNEYTVSAILSSGSYIRVYKGTNSYSNHVVSTNSSATFTVDSSYGGYVTIRFDNNVATGTFDLTNPQLELGATATPFEPQNESYLYVAQDADKNPISLASNNDGSVADEVYKRDGQWYRLNRFVRNMVLDGSFGWDFDSDYSGFKRARFPIGNGITDSEIVTKYDGKPLLKFTIDQPDTARLYTELGNLYVYFSDSDSGWGESYTATSDEIKAYFFGWRMNNGTFGTVYTGATGDVKTWVPIGDTDNTRATTVLPTADAPTIAEGKICHYKLTYQLAQATEEAIEVEGSLDLIDGGNQLEVGEAVIVREKVTPALSNDGTTYFINIKSVSYVGTSNPLKYTPKAVLAILKNGVIDTSGWVILTNTDGYGNILLKHLIANFDSEADYTVTYIALDTYKLSSSENSVEVTYNTNIKTVVDELVKRQEDDETDISVLKLQMIDAIARLTAGGL